MTNYDIKLSYASAGLPGNEGIAIRGFVPPNLKTIPADPITPLLLDRSSSTPHQSYCSTIKWWEEFPTNTTSVNLKSLHLSKLIS